MSDNNSDSEDNEENGKENGSTDLDSPGNLVIDEDKQSVNHSPPSIVVPGPGSEIVIDNAIDENTNQTLPGVSLVKGKKRYGVGKGGQHLKKIRH